MAEPILYMGKSGVGKSSALRNLPSDKTIILTPNAKTFPFPNSYKRGVNHFVNNKLTGGNPDSKYPLETIGLKDFIQQVAINATHVKYLVIDDFTHFFSARIFSTEFLAQSSGNAAFQRWNEFGSDVFQSLFLDAPNLREDLKIIVIHHTELKEDGTRGFKSSGKLLDNAIDVPSYFTTVLHGVILSTEDGPRYRIQTKELAGRQAKTPPGAFEDDYVINDLNVVMETLEKYNSGKVEVPADHWK